tara:strand:+ start:183 stop:4952 length:4770 start_codon:yes stop_codon:yes gene_type:complete
MNLEDNLVKIKKKFTNKSSFIYSTYVWNFYKINPNSKGSDLYSTQLSKTNDILKEVFKDPDIIKNGLVNKGYTFTKTTDLMKTKLNNLGINFNIKNFWHKKISMPLDTNNNVASWFDLHSKTKQPNNSDAFEKIMKELNICIGGLNENIIKTNEIICSGRRSLCFCFGKFNFKNTTTNDNTRLGITVILLGPGINERNSGKYLPEDGQYDVIVTMREKKTYGELTNRLIKKCNELNMNYYVEIYSVKNDNYQNLINYKPNFIHNTIDKFDMPVIYTDADMYPTQYLDLFDQKHFDCMLYNARSGIADQFHNELTMGKLCYTIDEMNISGGTMYWSNSSVSKNALKLWEHISNNNKGKADDRILDVVFNSTYMVQNLKCYWLPTSYIYITEKLNSQGAHLRDYVNKPVIIHPEDITAEEMIGSSRSRMPVDYYFSRSREAEIDESNINFKFECTENTYTIKDDSSISHYDYENELKKIKGVFNFFEEDENLLFNNVSKNNSFLEISRKRNKMLDKLNICSYVEYDFNYKLNNINIKYVNEYKFIYKKNSKVVFTLYTDDIIQYEKKKKELTNLSKYINDEYSILFIKLDPKCKCKLLTSYLMSFSLFEKNKLNNENIKVLAIKANHFNKGMDLLKSDKSDEYFDYYYKYHTVNLHIILADPDSEFHCVNYNNLINKKTGCYDKYILNIAPMSLTCFKNTRNCKYFISKCYNEFNKLLIKDTNNITEYRIIDNVFNRNMLRIFWKYHWLPEEYIFGYTACEDYVCDVKNIEDYNKQKITGKGKDLENWNKIQEKLIKCNKTFQSSSSLFIAYTKNYPNFLIDDDAKYRIGEHPKKNIKNVISTSSVSTIHSTPKKNKTYQKKLVGGDNDGTKIGNIGLWDEKNKNNWYSIENVNKFLISMCETSIDNEANKKKISIDAIKEIYVATFTNLFRDKIYNIINNINVGLTTFIKSLKNDCSNLNIKSAKLIISGGDCFNILLDNTDLRPISPDIDVKLVMVDTYGERLHNNGTNNYTDVNKGIDRNKDIHKYNYNLIIIRNELDKLLTNEVSKMNNELDKYNEFTSVYSNLIKHCEKLIQNKNNKILKIPYLKKKEKIIFFQKRFNHMESGYDGLNANMKNPFKINNVLLYSIDGIFEGENETSYNGLSGVLDIVISFPTHSGYMMGNDLNSYMSFKPNTLQNLYTMSEMYYIEKDNLKMVNYGLRTDNFKILKDFRRILLLFLTNSNVNKNNPEELLQTIYNKIKELKTNVNYNNKLAELNEIETILTQCLNFAIYKGTIQYSPQPLKGGNKNDNMDQLECNKIEILNLLIARGNDFNGETQYNENGETQNNENNVENQNSIFKFLLGGVGNDINLEQIVISYKVPKSFYFLISDKIENDIEISETMLKHISNYNTDTNTMKPENIKVINYEKLTELTKGNFNLRNEYLNNKDVLTEAFNSDALKRFPNRSFSKWAIVKKLDPIKKLLNSITLELNNNPDFIRKLYYFDLGTCEYNNNHLNSEIAKCLLHTYMYVFNPIYIDNGNDTSYNIVKNMDLPVDYLTPFKDFYNIIKKISEPTTNTTLKTSIKTKQLPLQQLNDLPKKKQKKQNTLI